MKRKHKLLLIVLFILLLVFISIPFWKGSQASVSYIAQYMKLYGYQLKESVIKQSQIQFEPNEVCCGDVAVKFDEVLYDGQWLFTAATVRPNDASRILVLPGGAEFSDRVSGFNGENQNGDHRSFRTAAQEDQKQLLCVYVYIKEFDQLSAYFLDSFQEKGSSVLLSGAQFAGGAENVKVNWTIQIFDVNLMTGKYTYLQEYTVPMVLNPLGNYSVQKYRIVTPLNGIPLEEASIITTALSSYLVPAWNEEQNQRDFTAILVDQDGEPLSPGVPPAVDSYSLDSIPNEITMQIYSQETGERLGDIRCIADHILSDSFSSIKGLEHIE